MYTDTHSHLYIRAHMRINKYVRRACMLTYAHVSVCACICLGVYRVHVCLRVCTYAQASIDIHMHAHEYTCSYVPIRRYTYLHLNKHGRVNAYRCTRVCTCDVYGQVCVYVYADTYVHAFICTHIRLCTCTRVCTRVYIHMYAHLDAYM